MYCDYSNKLWCCYHVFSSPSSVYKLSFPSLRKTFSCSSLLSMFTSVITIAYTFTLYWVSSTRS